MCGAVRSAGSLVRLTCTGCSLSVQMLNDALASGLHAFSRCAACEGLRSGHALVRLHVVACSLSGSFCQHLCGVLSFLSHRTLHIILLLCCMQGLGGSGGSAGLESGSYCESVTLADAGPGAALLRPYRVPCCFAGWGIVRAAWVLRQGMLWSMFAVCLRCCPARLANFGP